MAIIGPILVRADLACRVCRCDIGPFALEKQTMTIADPALFLAYKRKAAENPNVTWTDLEDLRRAVEEATKRSKLPTKGILRVAIEAIRGIDQ